MGITTMEHNILSLIQLRVDVFVSPLLLRLTLILLIGFSLGVGCIKVLAFGGVPSHDPFGTFVDVLPGQAKGALEAHGFTCTLRSYYPYNGRDYCSLDFPSGTFSEVNVIVFGGIIQQTDFTLRDDTLKLGDLTALWGMPDI